MTGTTETASLCTGAALATWTGGLGVGRGKAAVGGGSAALLPGSGVSASAATLVRGAAFGTSGAPGFSPFDFDNNGTIDSVDLGAIGARFGFSV